MSWRKYILSGQARKYGTTLRVLGKTKSHNNRIDPTRISRVRFLRLLIARVGFANRCTEIQEYCSHLTLLTSDKLMRYRKE